MTAQTAGGRLNQSRILVVDDNEASRYAKSRVLRQAGCLVLEASNGADALDRVAEGVPDLILLDVRLPDISGLEVCRRIKSNPRTAPITVLQMSALFRDDKSKVEGLEGGADGYIAEPVEPSLLVATVAAFLRARKAEQAVREHAMEWQATFDAITDGIALLDNGGGILRCNRALAGLFQSSANDMAGRVLDDVLPPSPPDSPTWDHLDPSRRQQMERTVQDRTFNLTIDPLCAHENAVRGWVCIVSDVTEKKRMDQQLWHTQKLESIGVLAGGVAHDFNNLLMGILGNASLALESIGDQASNARALRDIVRASERAADLTRQLLAYAGKGRTILQRVDLSKMVTSLLPLIQTSFAPKVELKLELASDLPAVEADRTQIEQIAMNLLINAGEAIGDNAGTVSVRTEVRHLARDESQHYLAEHEVRGDYVLLEVDDTGIGMDDATLRQIFDPFFTTKFMGRGLGLSAVLGIVRSHRGAIRVNSARGCGTRFELLFPITAAPAPAQPSSNNQLERGRGTILVVDDDEIVRELFKTSLERQGYSVLTASNGVEALQVFSKNPRNISVVLLDLVMPVMTGKEVLPRLLAVNPDVRVIVVSGQVEEEVRRELAAWDVAGFIQKPCGVKALVKKIQQFAPVNN